VLQLAHFRVKSLPDLLILAFFPQLSHLKCGLTSKPVIAGWCALRASQHDTTGRSKRETASER
jgi:hypothetical protein